MQAYDEVYKFLNDEQLRKLATEKESLEPEAQVALDAEIRFRSRHIPEKKQLAQSTANHNKFSISFVRKQEGRDRTVNKRQKQVLLTGVLLVALSGIFPPWIHVHNFDQHIKSNERAGYYPVFLPPHAKIQDPDFIPIRKSSGTTPIVNEIDDPSVLDTHPDWNLLKLQWATIILVTAGLMLWLKSSP